jgi:hypothetical protein
MIGRSIARRASPTKAGFLLRLRKRDGCGRVKAEPFFHITDPSD